MLKGSFRPTLSLTARIAPSLALGLWLGVAEANWVPQSFSEAFAPESVADGRWGSIGLGSTSYITPPGALSQGNFSLIEMEGAAARRGAEVDLVMHYQAGVGIQCADCNALEFPEIYIGSSKRLGPWGVQFGRVRKPWSVLDQAWQLGIIQPRFVYDYLNPESVGLSGLFADYQSDRGRVSFFASPMFIPDRGLPVNFENGKVGSVDPFFRAPISEVVFEDQPTPIQYVLKSPSVGELLLKPALGVTATAGNAVRGFSVNSSYAYKPINQILLAYSARYNLSFEVADAEVYPRVLMHHVATCDLAYNSEHFSLGLSGLREVPVRDETPRSWNTQEVAPAWAVSPALELRPSGRRGNVPKLYASALRVWGGNAFDRGPLAVDNGTAFDLRYRQSTALKLGLESPLWGSLGERMRLKTQTLFDLEHSAQIYTHSLEYRASPRWRWTVAADILYAPKFGSDFISSNRTNDRLSGGVAYVF